MEILGKTSSTIFDYSKWQELLRTHKLKYQETLPYPHIVLDEFLETWAANKALTVFPKVVDKGWIHYIHVNEKKHGLNKLELIPKFIREHIIKEFNSIRFINYLERLTGIPSLIPDTSFEGGGIHQTERSGFLNIHADFTVHPHKKNWRRRVNLLLYLNKNWEVSYNGDLELWDKEMTHCVRKIAPIFNRAVIFNTDQDSFHGVPEPLNCPDENTRKSIAIYYFTEEKPGSFKKRATNYKARPNDGYKSIFIWLDKQCITLYSKFKGVFGINDDFISKFLQMFDRKQKK